MSNSDSTEYWTHPLLVNPTKCMPLFSVNQPSLQIYFLHTNSYLSVMFGIHDPSKYLLMSKPKKQGFFILNLIEALISALSYRKCIIQNTSLVGNGYLGKLILHILVGIKKSSNSSVYLMQFRHLLTFPPSPFHIEIVERRGREKFKTEPSQSLFFDVEVSFDKKLDKGENDKHKTQETVFHLRSSRADFIF